MATVLSKLKVAFFTWSSCELHCW